MSEFDDVAHREFRAKMMEVANLQADAALKDARAKHGPWAVIALAFAMGCVTGGALVGGLVRYKMGW